MRESVNYWTADPKPSRSTIPRRFTSRAVCSMLPHRPLAGNGLERGWSGGSDRASNRTVGRWGPLAS